MEQQFTDYEISKWSCSSYIEVLPRILENMGLNLKIFTDKKRDKGQEGDTHSFYHDIQSGLNNDHVKYLPIY